MKKIGILLICAMLLAAPGAGVTEGEKAVFSLCAEGKHIPSEQAVIIREAEGMQKGIIGCRCVQCGRMFSLSFFREERKGALK